MDPEVLFEQARRGDAQAWNDLLDWMRPHVRAAVRQRMRCPEDASDVTNEAQIRMHEKRGQFNGESLHQFRAWARRVAANVLIDFLRRKGRDVESLVFEPAAPGPDTGPPDVSEVLARALDRLPADQRRIIEMRFFDGLRLTEVADRLDRPASTVRVYYKRGIENLSRRLRGES